MMIGTTPVSQHHLHKPAIDPQPIDNQNVELSKVKSDVSSIKSMMNEIMQIVQRKIQSIKKYQMKKLKLNSKILKN